MNVNAYIMDAGSLVTTREQTRAGFLRIALEKNRAGDPYVKNALAFKAMAGCASSPDDFLQMPAIRPFLLTAAGLSDKSMNYLTEDDKTAAIKELIEKFLKPAGGDFMDEATYRYLLIKGDAVGGSMRNRIGMLCQEKLIRAIFSSMDVQGMPCDWLAGEDKTFAWRRKAIGEAGIESRVKALHWENACGHRILALNMTIPTVRKNVDICLYAGDTAEYDRGRIVGRPERAMMFGELKGGIDPAGADEHWKTGNTALIRIRQAFAAAGYPAIRTSFVGGAIANAMAEEIFGQLQSGILSNAANLNDTNQLIAYCSWMLQM